MYTKTISLSRYIYCFFFIFNKLRLSNEIVLVINFSYVLMVFLLQSLMSAFESLWLFKQSIIYVKLFCTQENRIPAFFFISYCFCLSLFYFFIFSFLHRIWWSSLPLLHYILLLLLRFFLLLYSSVYSRLFNFNGDAIIHYANCLTNQSSSK